MYAFGVDIGGTGVKSGIVDENGRIIVKSYIKTDKAGPLKVIADIAVQLKGLAVEADIPVYDIAGVGIGCPGAIDGKRGTVDYSNNLRWTDVPLASELSAALGLPVKVSNDANVAALGETVFGAGKEYSDTVFLTLGTGVGGGVIIENHLFEGNDSKGTELGHVVIVPHGEECTCGRRGCLEAYASATALIRETRAAMLANRDSKMWEFVGGDIDKVDGRVAFECMKAGDKSAKAVVDEYLYYLGEGITNFVNIFRPQAVILGGGVCAQGKYLTEPLKKFIDANAYGSKHSPSVELLIATLGNDAGLIGAASLVLKSDFDTLR